jgi:hypothetical protein
MEKKIKDYMTKPSKDYSTLFSEHMIHRLKNTKSSKSESGS